MEKKVSSQVGIKLAIGTGDAGVKLLRQINDRSRESGKKSRNDYILSLIISDLKKARMAND